MHLERQSNWLSEGAYLRTAYNVYIYTMWHPLSSIPTLVLEQGTYSRTSTIRLIFTPYVTSLTVYLAFANWSLIPRKEDVVSVLVVIQKELQSYQLDSYK